MSQNQALQNKSKVAPQVSGQRVIKDKHEVNITMLFIVLLIFLIGSCCGYLGLHMFGNDFDKMQVLYVSRSEIMALEEARLDQERDPEGRMFFGKINRAINLIRREAINYEDKYSRVIFVGDNYVEGKNTKSISKLVYEKVINQLGGKINAGEQKVSNNK
ncbi:MAG: hypothetical protein ACEY3D_00115 [Rickettsia sp.]|uniref:hypothetical protein n=1 Tax=Rickettsia sp. TaxID=789 RepID=UPI003979A481